MEKKIRRLAKDLDQFLLDRDPCGYYAAVDSREEGFDMVFQALKGGDVSGFIAYIKEDLSETVKTDSLRPVEKKILGRLKMLKSIQKGE